jgi:hypothetical protein
MAATSIFTTSPRGTQQWKSDGAFGSLTGLNCVGVAGGRSF